MLKINFPYFKSVRFIYSQMEGVAKSNPNTGELVLNRYYWDRLPEEHQIFVLAHEEGHVFKHTRDELAADEYASKKYLDAGGSLLMSVQALTSQLKEDNPVHVARAWMQYQRALQYDYQHNGNAKAYRPMYDTNETVKRKIFKNGYIGS